MMINDKFHFVMKLLHDLNIQLQVIICFAAVKTQTNFDYV